MIGKYVSSWLDLLTGVGSGTSCMTRVATLAMLCGVWYHCTGTPCLGDGPARWSGGASRYGSLCVVHRPRPQVKHYHIKQTPRGEFYLSEKHTCASIPELINYHQHNSGGLATRLKQPPLAAVRSAPATAGLSHGQYQSQSHMDSLQSSVVLAHSLNCDLCQSQSQWHSATVVHGRTDDSVT